MVGARRRLLIGLLVLVTAVAFEAQAVSTAMPAVAADLGQLDLYAWAFTAFVIPQILAIVLAGRLCDDVGPVRPLQAGVAVFGLGVVLSAVAWSMPVFLAGRFVQGFGGGLLNLALMVVVGRAFPPEDTGRVMTYFSFAWMMPSFLGPSAAAWIVRVSDWHAVFWGVLPFVLAGVLLLGPALARVDLPGLRAAGTAPATLSGALAAALGVGLIQAAGQSPGWWSGPLALAGLGLLVWSLRGLMPVGWAPLGAGLPAVIAVRALTTGAFFGASAFLPLMLVRLRGEELTTAGIVLTVASLGWTLGSWVQSRTWLLISRDAIVTVGAVLVAGGLGLVAAFTLAPAWPLAGVVAGVSVAGAGMGLASSSTSILVMQLSAEHQLGRNTGALQVGEAMGNALVAGLAGTLFVWFKQGVPDEALTRSVLVQAFGAPSLLVAGCALAAVGFTRRMGFVPNLSARRP
nr:MFS transporter [Propionibacterium sp.]